MKKAITILLACTCLSAMAQQDPLYSQYQFNQLMINPAYAGIYDRFSAGIIRQVSMGRNRRLSRTNTITVNSALSDGKIGLGGLIMNDRFGVNNNYEIQVASSYNISFNRTTKLAMGIQGGFVQYGL